MKYVQAFVFEQKNIQTDAVDLPLKQCENLPSFTFIFW